MGLAPLAALPKKVIFLSSSPEKAKMSEEQGGMVQMQRVKFSYCVHGIQSEITTLGPLPPPLLAKGLCIWSGNGDGVGP